MPIRWPFWLGRSGQRYFRGFLKRNAVIGFCALSLAGCNVPSPFPDQQQNRTEVYAPPPAVAPESGMPVLKPMDLRADQLFSVELRNNEERIERVENVVIAIKEEIDSFSELRPAIERLVAIESEFEDLVGMLQNLLQTKDVATMPKPASLPVTEATQIQQPVALPPPLSPASVPADVVQGLNLRIGEHPGYTRTVFDLSASASYRADLDNGENILVVEMPGVFWVGPASAAQVNSPLIASWNAQTMANEEGTRIVIQLRHPVTIASEETLSDPNRVILDIQRKI